jgi:SAM-dependent methyltransferase
VTDEAGLAATWPFVRDHLPAPPARILEVGCGPLGGYIPNLCELGYEAVGVDPEAPAGPAYRQVRFEDHEVGQPLDAIVAATSLHHVADLDAVLDRIEALLKSGGTVVVVEWAHERFDDATASWCFDRLSADGDSWLHHHRQHWRESGQSWDRYFQEWVGAAGLHAGGDILRALRARFDTAAVSEGPYLFADLPGITKADEQAALAAGLIQPNGLFYVGNRASSATRNSGSVAART